jgi:hypothetical protein
MDFHLIISGLFSNAPTLVIWITALILASVLMKRGGGKPERFLTLGSSLMLVSTFLSIPKEAIVFYLDQSSLSNVTAATIISCIRLFLGLISLTGTIFLFNAIWKKFNEKHV